MPLRLLQCIHHGATQQRAAAARRALAAQAKSPCSCAAHFSCGAGALLAVGPKLRPWTIHATKAPLPTQRSHPELHSTGTLNFTCACTPAQTTQAPLLTQLKHSCPHNKSPLPTRHSHTRPHKTATPAFTAQATLATQRNHPCSPLCSCGCGPPCGCSVPLAPAAHWRRGSCGLGGCSSACRWAQWL